MSCSCTRDQRDGLHLTDRLPQHRLQWIQAVRPGSRARHWVGADCVGVNWVGIELLLRPAWQLFLVGRQERSQSADSPPGPSFQRAADLARARLVVEAMRGCLLRDRLHRPDQDGRARRPACPCWPHAGHAAVRPGHRVKVCQSDLECAPVRDWLCSLVLDDLHVVMHPQAPLARHRPGLLASRVKARGPSQTQAVVCL